MNISPEQTLRRSPLYRRHVAAGANFSIRDESCVVSCFSSLEEEKRQMQALAIIDLSPLARTGFKGSDTMQELEKNSIATPQIPNQAVVHEDGVLVARLSQQEVFILDSLASDSDRITQINAAWQETVTGNSFELKRSDSHAWFALTGIDAPQVLAKVCAVDMRLDKFPDLNVAQTSVARSNSIVIRCDNKDVPCFYILADLSGSEFLWDCLLDAMAEYEGKAIGLEALIS